MHTPDCSTTSNLVVWILDFTVTNLPSMKGKILSVIEKYPVFYNFKLTKSSSHITRARNKMVQELLRPEFLNQLQKFCCIPMLHRCQLFWISFMTRKGSISFCPVSFFAKIQPSHQYCVCETIAPIGQSAKIITIRLIQNFYSGLSDQEIDVTKLTNI